MSIGKAQAQATTILQLLVATCVMMEASLAWAEPIAPIPYAPGPSTSISKSNQQLELLRLAAVLGASSSGPAAALPKISIPDIGSGLLPFNIIGGAEECLSSVINTRECPLQIIISIISGRLGDIGPECCKAVLSVQEGCLAKIPIVGSLIPPVLTDTCGRKILAA